MNPPWLSSSAALWILPLQPSKSASVTVTVSVHLKKTQADMLSQGQTENSRKNVTHFLLHCGKQANHPSLLPKLRDICWADWTLTLTSKVVSLTALQRSEDKHKGDNNLNAFRLALYQLATGTTKGTLTTAGLSFCAKLSDCLSLLKKKSSLRGKWLCIHWQTIITLSCTCCWSNFTLNFCQAVNFSWAALCNVYYNCLL